jgi:hypothetical protein
MRSRILMLTKDDDAHAYAVYLGLLHKGGDPVLWHTVDFPVAETESILLSGGDLVLSIHGPRIDLSDQAFRSIWRRRPSQILAPRLHLADREFAQAECRSFRQSLFCLLSPDAFWVNPPAAAMLGSRKPLQLHIAQMLGVTVPETLFTNDPNAIRYFIRHQGGQVIFKTLTGVSWNEQGSSWAPYTTLLREEDLIEDFLLKATPGIYQELVAKDFELRVTVMGNRVFAAKIRSQETIVGKLDWRRAYDELLMEPYSLPSSVEELCRQLVQRLGLVFGCLDFIVTPSGDYVFLEVNEMGQFLFVERYTGLPLLDAFCEFLLQGKADFDWSTRGDPLRYVDFEPKLDELSRALGITKEQSSDALTATEAEL